MAISNVGELSAAVADFLNRDDLDSIMDTLIDTAQDRILFDPRFRGELTETLLTKARDGLDHVNPLRTHSFWDETAALELSDVPVVEVDEATGALTETFVEYDPDQTIDLEIVRLYIDDQEYTRVNDYSDILNAEANEYLYCEVGGKYYLSGWEIQDENQDINLGASVFTFVANEKSRLGAVEVADTETGNTIIVTTSRPLKQYPNIFLYATLVEAAIYLRDSEFLQVYQVRYEELMDKLAKDWKRKQISAGFDVRSAPRRAS